MAFGKINLTAVVFIPSHLFDVIHVAFFGKYNGIRMDIHPFFSGT